LSEAVAGGGVVKISFEAAAGVTVMGVLVCVPPESESVAVNVHDVPVVITTLENVATLDVAATDNVEPPLKLHEESDITMWSVGLPPEVIVTLKLVSVAPATTVD
jgi:hypothetical protein